MSRATASGEDTTDSTVRRPNSGWCGSWKFPASVIPYERITISASGPGSSARTSSGVHTKNFPSIPSESASCALKKPPSGERISRSRYASVSRATRRKASSPVTWYACRYVRASCALS